MDSSKEIPFLTISQLAPLIKEREVSPLEVVNAFLERVDLIDRHTNAFITLMREEALEAARQAEKQIAAGNYLGPLHGVPIGLKDLFYTKGVRTTAGSKIERWAQFVPEEDATVVTRFKEAGAIVLGKLSMHEFAAGATGFNPHYGSPRNPWALDRITGGSSGGSGAAVAASLCAVAMGTDTGGSVRIPSTLCGIVGLKPTYGRVSRFGIVPLSWSLDHAGPMTKSVRDAALAMNAISGYDSRDPASAKIPVPDFTAQLDAGVNGLRLGIPSEHFFDWAETEVAEAVQRAIGVLEELGASVVEVSLPSVSTVRRFHMVIAESEAAAFHQETVLNHGDELTPNVRDRFEEGLMLTAVQYIQAQRARARVREEVRQALEQVDVLVTPTSLVTAPGIGQDTVATDEGEEPVLRLLSRNTQPFNDSGVPACTVPCGFDSSGLPVGLQIAGRAFDEATVLRAAHAYEQATDWHTRGPTI